MKQMEVKLKTLMGNYKNKGNWCSWVRKKESKKNTELKIKRPVKTIN